MKLEDGIGTDLKSVTFLQLVGSLRRNLLLEVVEDEKYTKVVNTMIRYSGYFLVAIVQS